MTTKFKKVDTGYICNVTLAAIARSIGKTDGKRKKMHAKSGSFSYIPVDLDNFIQKTNLALQYLREHGVRKSRAGFTFLDAGCGAGITLALARNIGFSYTIGLEMDTATIRIAKTLNHTSLNKIIRTDIRRSNMYGKADVVYYYVPMSNRKNQIVFECRVANCLRVGSVVIPYGSSRTFQRSQAFEANGKKGNTSAYGNFYVKTRQIIHSPKDYYTY